MTLQSEHIERQFIRRLSTNSQETILYKIFLYIVNVVMKFCMHLDTIYGDYKFTMIHKSTISFSISIYFSKDVLTVDDQQK